MRKSDSLIVRLRSAAAALTMTLTFLALPSMEGAKAADPMVGTASVIDAGTLRIGGQKIRLYGIEAPDADQACLRDAKPWKCGAEAAKALERRLDGHTVKCEPYPSDSSEYLVAKCTVGSDNLSELLVSEGWAVDSPEHSKGEYADEQDEAKSARRGLWASESDNPEELRRQRQR